jgi:hypothetical protein
MAGGDLLTLNVAVEQGSSPQAALEPSALTLGPLDDSSVLEISNPGGSTLDWTLASAATWASVNPASGRLAPGSLAQVVVSANRSGLTRGTYIAPLYLTSNGGSRTATLTMEVGEGAGLHLDPPSIDFGLSSSQLPVRIVNDGYEALNWSAEPGASWISLSSRSGQIPPRSNGFVTVTASRNGLTYGPHQAAIRFTSNGGSAALTVNVTASPAGPPPSTSPSEIDVTPASLDFGGTTSELQVLVSNGGNDPLNWTGQPDASWATLSPNSGLVTGHSSTPVVVKASRAGLTAGTYQTTVRFLSSGGTKTVTLLLVVPSGGPTPNPEPEPEPDRGQIHVTPASLNFGEAATKLNLLIQNTGASTVSYSAQSSDSWLTLGSTSGTILPGVTRVIEVTASRAGLSATGSYQASIQLTSNGGNVTVPVTLQVPPSPTPPPSPPPTQIHVTPASLNFGEAATKLNLLIQNTGASTVSYSAQSSNSWLTLGSTSGTILPGVTRVIEVTASRAGLSATGSYQASIQLTSNGGNVTVPVSLQVPPPPSPPPTDISVTPTSLDFGEGHTKLYLLIQNNGDSAGSYSVQSSTSWLTLGATSGTILPTVTRVIEVTASRAGLSIGSYQGSIQLTLEGRNMTVPVSLQVIPPPPPTPPGGWNLGNIDATGKLDVTDPLNAYLAGVPNGSVIQFPAGARYRAEGVIRLIDKNDIVIEGNGATIFATTDGGGVLPPEDLKHLWPRGRSHVRLDGGMNIHIKNLRIVGANPHAGLDDAAYVEQVEAQHAFWIAGSVGVELEGVYASDVYGDFVYISSGANDVHVHHSFFERNGRQGVAITGGQNILIEANTFNDIRRSSIDLEPSTAGGGAVNVTIRSNTFGARRLTFVASLGAGANVRNIVVEDNTLASPMTVIVGVDGYRRGPFYIRNNRSTAGFGADAPLMVFTNVDGVQVVGNYQSLSPNRSRMGVGVRNCTNVDVHDNDFPGGLYELVTSW